MTRIRIKCELGPFKHGDTAQAVISPNNEYAAVYDNTSCLWTFVNYQFEKIDDLIEVKAEELKLEPNRWFNQPMKSFNVEFK